MHLLKLFLSALKSSNALFQFIFQLKKIRILFFIAICLFSTFSESNQSLLSLYDNEFIKINYINNLVLTYQGESSPVGFWLSDKIKQQLYDDPEALPFITKYEHLFNGCFTALWGSLIVEIGVPIAMVYIYPYLINEQQIIGTATAITLFVGAVVAEVVSIIMLPQSFEALFSSVNIYNRNLLKRYQNLQ